MPTRATPSVLNDVKIEAGHRTLKTIVTFCDKRQHPHSFVHSMSTLRHSNKCSIGTQWPIRSDVYRNFLENFGTVSDLQALFSVKINDPCSR